MNHMVLHSLRCLSGVLSAYLPDIEQWNEVTASQNIKTLFAVGRHAALAPISENITPRDWQLQRSDSDHDRALNPNADLPGMAAASAGGVSESRPRPGVLPRLTDPARPSTGHLRHNGPHARSGAGFRSQADMNMKMESLLSRARESQAQNRDSRTIVPPVVGGSIRSGWESASRQ